MANLTNLYMNWSSVTITPQPSGTAVVLKHVTDVKPARQSQNEEFYGDALQFPALIRAVQASRGIEVTSGDVAAIMALDPKTVYTVVAVLNHAESGTLTVTLANAVIKQTPTGGQNNKYASGSVTFVAFGGTNDADPMTVNIGAGV